nr:GT-D fold domain-containing glycosyltransferase [Microbacterium bovistercoris]
MFYYLLRLVGKLIPGEARRGRFSAWARSRFSLHAIVETALADHRKATEGVTQNAIYYHSHLFEMPVVMTVDDTLNALIGGKSIARFGDGELLSIESKKNAFQRPDAALADRLREVLSSDEPGLLVAIYRHNYQLSDDLDHNERRWYIENAAWMHSVCDLYLRRETVYAATETTHAYQMYENFDSENYFRGFRSVWEGEKVVLIHGDGIFDHLTHDIFDNAASVDHILAPKYDAFDDYDDILHRALQAPQDSLVIAILGPTATVLAYDLHRAGYRALDLGHIAKSYDWWLNGRAGKGDATAEFYAPD